jgi:Mor family transcriptional regulator
MSVIEDLRCTIRDAIKIRARRKENTDAVATRVVDSLVARWGGATLYIPKGRAVKAVELVRDIGRRFDGTNALALSREYGISTGYLYRLVRKAAGHAAEHQRS